MQDSLQKQFQDISSIMRQKWPDCQFIAYFQANTNTYGTVDELKERFEPFVNMKDVVGIAIATRPDCLSDEICDYLEQLSHRCDLYIDSSRT